ncbi:universal stress protein [Actinoplanes regularis]|uniref:Nucleotide-binding universal stress protein, UspA family n=1 Tax=Actinoplanes regularis TaxID=52697 RepID=A0A239K4F5_9ACTN|nr:universal stress protein [Actinoplanes regularis]GIE92404.1 universal stress protein [Actinoplanes regularis]SNT12840.1 Nucleotide-binding universal stress protein, UspA family [Actinoplanes regularis]
MRHQLIVVGVDGSESGRRALEWAAQEAADRVTAVQAVMAWHWDGAGAEMLAVTSPEQQREQSAAVLDREVKAVVAEHGSQMPIAAELIEGSPAEVLTTASRDADLLVLGSHGHSPLRHRVLGSVSESCIRRAACPVVVIPSGPARPEPNRDPVVREATTAG